MSPSERLATLLEEARTTPIPTFYGGDVVDIAETERLEGYIALTTAYHDKKGDRERMFGVVRDLVAGGTPYKIVYAGDETWSAASGNALHPGWEIWRSRVGYVGRR